MSDEQTPPEECSGAPTPGEQHALLKPFEGRFRAQVKLWMGPGEPMESSGTMINSFQLGGLYLHQDYSGDPTDGPFPAFKGKGYWGYNTVDKRYEGFWIDNASTMMQSEHGSVDESGKEWTMTSEMTNPMNGQPMKKRSVIRVIDEDHHSMETYFIVNGQEGKGMEIQYERAK